MGTAIPATATQDLPDKTGIKNLGRSMYNS
jgi:hypothetical protein